nr:hypothetical protein CFP56_00462 [Quercus suber]
MLVKGQSRLFSAAGLLFFLAALIFLFSGPRLHTPDYFKQRINDAKTVLEGHGGEVQDTVPHHGDLGGKPVGQVNRPAPVAHRVLKPASESRKKSHLVVSSSITKDGTYFPVLFGDRVSMNPNILPHPNKTDTYIMVAQQYKNTTDPMLWFTELVCESSFQDGVLACNGSPLLLPIAATTSVHCIGEKDFFNYNIGPHDARVFWGPDTPYIIYGTQSAHTCFGQFIQDFRRLIDWSRVAVTFPDQKFFFPTDMERPPPYGDVEKNWFAFWDSQGDMYIHYDSTPKRIFSKLEADGSVGPDLGELVEAQDEVCMGKHMPKFEHKIPESIHQATNSLAITMCKRSDPSCERTTENTFIFQIFQYKTFWYFHGVYEPYLMLFQESAPFAVHAISARPLWINGRGDANTGWTSVDYLEDQSEMVYITSISWKDVENRYHGYLDDTLFLAFGIEDSRAGAIDVLAGDLMADLAFC